MDMNIGDRMKDYEACAKRFLVKNMPVIVRVDGRAFHTYTRNFERPFSEKLSQAMNYAAMQTMREMQGCKCAFLQSDEASFALSDHEDVKSQSWFGNKQSKLETLAASLFTGHFNRFIENYSLAFFDARAFNIPIQDVPNYFIWRQKDWMRNSVNMLGRHHFSAKSMHGLSVDAVKRKLKTISDVDWEKLDNQFKYGRLIWPEKDGVHKMECEQFDYFTLNKKLWK